MPERKEMLAGQSCSLPRETLAGRGFLIVSKGQLVVAFSILLLMENFPFEAIVTSFQGISSALVILALQ